MAVLLGFFDARASSDRVPVAKPALRLLPNIGGSIGTVNEGPMRRSHPTDPMLFGPIRALTVAVFLASVAVGCGSGPSPGAGAGAVPRGASGAEEGQDPGDAPVIADLPPESPPPAAEPNDVQPAAVEPAPPASDDSPVSEPTPVPVASSPVSAGAAGTTADPGDWAFRTLAGMTLREKIGQMIMPRILGDFSPEGSEAFDEIVRLVEAGTVGGVIVATGTPMDVATKLNILQRRSPVPLLTAADLETGAGFRMRGAVYLPGGTDLGGATDFPSLMALGATGDSRLAYEMGRVTGVEARALGIHLPFAPVLDVNNNPENPVINTRSIGEDPELVSALGVCLARGIQDHGGIATGKHFPGHGDTDTDSHLALPIIRLDRGRMEEVELLPFRRAIDQGIGAIMTAHIALPEVTESPDLPATLSRNVLTSLLREDMGFEGVIFTDAMNMSAIDGMFGRDEATVRAVEAGADVILMPFDPEATLGSLMRAVESGRLPEARIDESALRLLRVKAELGLPSSPTVDLEAVFGAVGTSDHLEVAREVAERSLTLLQNSGDLLPLAGTRTANVLSVSVRRESDLLAGRAFNERLRATYPRLRTASITAGASREEFSRLAAEAEEADLVVVSLYVSEVSTDDEVAGSEELMDFMRRISGIDIPNIAVAFGNPYLIEEFPDIRSYLIAWGDSQASQRAAAGAILGDRAVSGRAPIRIPPMFEIGSGIQLAGPVVAPSGSGGCE